MSQLSLKCQTVLRMEHSLGINITMNRVKLPINQLKISIIYWRKRRKPMWLQIHPAIRITINCCIFTHPERLVYRKLLLLHIPDTFLLLVVFIIWQTSNPMTSSIHHCRCITLLAEWWALDKRFYSAQRLSFARNSPRLVTSPTVKSTNAR